MIDAKRLIQDLQSLHSNKAAMVAFKNSLSPARAHKAWPYIVRGGWCDLGDDRMRMIIQHITAFYARHPMHSPGICFGESIRNMAIKRAHGSVVDALEVNERYLNKLLASRSYLGLCARLPFVMRMIESTGVPVDYERLYLDLVYWNEDIKIRWATAYFTNKGGAQNVSDQNSD